MDARENTTVWSRIVETASAADRPVDLKAGGAACAEDLRADGLGITLITSGQIRAVVYATDGRSHRLEDAQLVAGEGPCTQAYVERRIVESDTDEARNRWPVFVRTAADLGVQSFTAVPLLVGDIALGSMDIYRAAPGSLAPADRVRAQAFSRVLALLVVDAYPTLLDRDEKDPGPGPQGYPPTVHQAAGAVAARTSMDIDEILARMRAHAFSHRQPLVDVAQLLLHGGLDLEEDRGTA
ncbi:GAF and ANTAR domain-containing protein [Streptomyces sp. NPDC054842]